MNMENTNKPRTAEFVADMIRRLKNDDSACRAALRRADNSATASFAWEYLVPYCNIQNDRERLPFALIGAAIAREQPENDGKMDMGEMLFRCTEGDSEAKDREMRRLRRLLACDSSMELVEILRSTVRYIQSKGNIPFGYERLLMDILYWNEKVKLRWTHHFFNKQTELQNKEV